MTTMMSSGIPVRMLREKYHQCGRRSSATDSPSWIRFLGYAMRVRIRQRARHGAALVVRRDAPGHGREFSLLNSQRARPYDAGTGKHEPGAGGAPQGAASGRQGRRSRCGDRAERDHPRTVRKPVATVETNPRGNPGERVAEEQLALSFGAAQAGTGAIRGNGEWPKEVPRGARSCDAAMTTRGLPRFWPRSGPRFARSGSAVLRSVVPLRYGAPVTECAPGSCSPASTTRSAPRSRAPPSRSRSSPARARARPASSPIASRGRRTRARSTPRTCSRSRSPARPRASSTAPRPARCAAVGHRRAPSTPSRSRSCAASAKTPASRCPRILERKVRVLMPLVGERGREAALVAAELASEIEWAKARLVSPDDYERAVAVAGRTPPRPAAQVASVYRDVRAREAQARRRRLRRPHLAVRRRARARPRVRRGAALAVPPPLRRRVPGRERGAVPPAARVARRPSRPLRRRRRRPGDLRVRGRRPRLPRAVHASSSRASATPTSASSRSAATTGPPRRSSRPRARCSAPPGRRATVRATPARRSRPRITEYDSDDAEARGVAARCARAHGPDLPWRRIAVLYRINAQSAAFEEALGRAGVPFRVRGGGRFLERPEVQVALDALRKTARAAPGRSFSEHLTDLTVDADDVRGAARAHRRARAARSRVPRRRGRPGIGRRLPRVPRHRVARRRRRRASAATRSSCSRSTAPRGSSSTPCSSPASNAASCRSRTPSPPRRSTRSNGCSTSR